MILLTKISFMILFIIIVYYCFLLRKNKKEYFNQEETKSGIMELLRKAKNELGDSEIYNVFHKSVDDEYILQDVDSKETLYKLIPKKTDEIFYNVTLADGKITGINGTQKDINYPSLYGKFEDSVAKIDFGRNEERIKIEVGNGKVTIIGIGGFGNESPYPYPWYKIMPIVYKEGNSIIGFMDYSGKTDEINNDKNSLPMEIVVSKNNKKYLPLFFEVYVMLQEYIALL